MLPQAPGSTLFPYTTLFRSRIRAALPSGSLRSAPDVNGWPAVGAGALELRRRASRSRQARSEEHTSELQSPYDLVCRLLLEKKKTTTSSPLNSISSSSPLAN